LLFFVTLFPLNCKHNKVESLEGDAQRPKCWVGGINGGVQQYADEDSEVYAETTNDLREQQGNASEEGDDNDNESRNDDDGHNRCLGS
jgi:hypothetical protein